MRITGPMGSLPCVVLLVAACTVPGRHRVEPAVDSMPALTSLTMAQRCTSFTTKVGAWPEEGTRLESTAWRNVGTTINSFMGPQTLPAHCEVNGVMRERTGVDGQHYAIHFRLRLPENWNRRLYFQGGGGLNGDVGSATGMSPPGQPTLLDRGYAVVSQDSGHDSVRNSVPAFDGPAAFGFDPQARAEYGGASIRPVTEASRAVIKAHYGQVPERSYYVGCSKGGQEGMYAAQREPELFDGIVAAAPGFSLPRAALASFWDLQAFGSLIDSEKRHAKSGYELLQLTFSDGQFSRLRAAVLAGCDADDGLEDGMTSDWRACTWERVRPTLQQQVCTNAPDCLSDQQIAVLGRVIGGPKDSSGKAHYSDWAVDAGVGSGGWSSWKIGATLPPGRFGPGGSFPAINLTTGGPALAAIFSTPPTAIGPDLSQFFEFALKFDFDLDAAKIYATDATFRRSAWQDIGARSPEMAAFRAHGGKMIVPHGVSDPIFSINDTVAWYQEVDQRNGGRAADFVRVFPVPGMAHCAGGPAVDRFDAFEALVAWVEHGMAPERIVAAAGAGTPWPGRTRPLCPFPKVARYDGTGNIEEATSFHCE